MLHALLYIFAWFFKATLAFARAKPRTFAGLVLCLALIALGSKGPTFPPNENPPPAPKLSAQSQPSAKATVQNALKVPQVATPAPALPPPAPKPSASPAPANVVTTATLPEPEPDFLPEPEPGPEEREQSFWQSLWNAFGSKRSNPEFSPDAEARRIDEALLQTLGAMRVPPRHISVLTRESRLSAEGEVYPYLRMIIAEPEKQHELSLALATALKRIAPAPVW